MSVYDWDRRLPPQSIAFDQRGMTVGGPVSLGGKSQVASQDAGYWIATYAGGPVDAPDRVRAFRALRARLQGGAHQIRVPAYDAEQSPWPGAVNVAGTVTFDDDVGFDDDAPFAQPTIGILTSAAAAFGATSMGMTIQTSAALEGGELFSIGDRLYVIEAVLASSGSNRTVVIWPRLREAVAAGVELNFDDPVCKMRVMTESEMDLLLAYGRRGQADMHFVEVF